MHTLCKQGVEYNNISFVIRISLPIGCIHSKCMDRDKL